MFLIVGLCNFISVSKNIVTADSRQHAAKRLCPLVFIDASFDAQHFFCFFMKLKSEILSVL